MARKTYEAEVEAEQEKALALCRGTYQRGIVLGRYRLSGADLKGKAKEYGIHYAKSRHNLLARLQRAGVAFGVLFENNKTTLVWGERMTDFCELQRQGLKGINPELVRKLRRAIETGYRYRALRDQAVLEIEMHKMVHEKKT